MGIKFPVGPGTLLPCDYSRGGFQPPEMVKAWIDVMVMLAERTVVVDPSDPIPE